MVQRLSCFVESHKQNPNDRTPNYRCASSEVTLIKVLVHHRHPPARADNVDFNRVPLFIREPLQMKLHKRAKVLFKIMVCSLPPVPLRIPHVNSC